MRHYEMMVVLDAELEDDAVEMSTKKIETLIPKYQGTIDKVDKLGKRRLAYEIKHKREGNYSIYYFHGDETEVHEIERALNITDEIIRFGIYRLPEKK